MKWSKTMRVAIGAVLLAAMLFALVAAPGFVSDRDSTVPRDPRQEARQ